MFSILSSTIMFLGVFIAVMAVIMLSARKVTLWFPWVGFGLTLACLGLTLHPHFQPEPADPAQPEATLIQADQLPSPREEGVYRI